MTAGIDGVYPRGLPVGVVVAVAAGTELFHRIRARPAVDLAQLSTLFLLERGPEPPRTAPSASAGAGIALEPGRP